MITNDTFSSLYIEFQSYVDKNDEQGARNFLIKNLQQFPEEVQAKLTLAFFEEALMDTTTKIKSVAEIQKEGLDAISQMDKLKKILEDKKKIEDIKSSLSK